MSNIYCRSPYEDGFKICMRPDGCCCQTQRGRVSGWSHFLLKIEEKNKQKWVCFPEITLKHSRIQKPPSLNTSMNGTVRSLNLFFFSAKAWKSKGNTEENKHKRRKNKAMLSQHWKVLRCEQYDWKSSTEGDCSSLWGWVNPHTQEGRRWMCVHAAAAPCCTTRPVSTRRPRRKAWMREEDAR